MRPTRKGEMIAPIVVVPQISATSWPEKRSVCRRKVAPATYHAPQMKYSRNIITESRSLICSCTELLPPRRIQSALLVICPATLHANRLAEKRSSARPVFAPSRSATSQLAWRRLQELDREGKFSGPHRRRHSRRK